MVESKHTNKIGPTDVLTTRPDIPENYHCDCEYCKTNFIGEIFDTENGKYYSQRCRNSYYPKDVNKQHNHLDVGHWPGYRFAVQNYTEEGDLVFDPTVGSGTAIVEAENNGRMGMGIELEFPEVAEFFTEGRGTVIHGDCLKVDPEEFLYKESIQLLINGTPYPTIGSKSSDAPERKSIRKVMLKDGELKPGRVSDSILKPRNTLDDYQHGDSLGKIKLKDYYEIIPEIYLRFLPYIKHGGFLGIIIKDLTVQKEAYPLHKYIIDAILERTDELEYHSSFMHAHIPTTMFMNTYPKRFPDVKIPLYQTGIILRRK